jgi:hypothetical protein
VSHALFAVVDAVLWVKFTDAAYDSAVVPMDVWEFALTLGWWRSCWPV